RRVGSRLDEIAGGIDLEEAQIAILDLAAQQERNIEYDVLRGERISIHPVGRADRLADELGGAKHALHRLHRLDDAVDLDPLIQQIYDLLTERQIARAQEHHHALARDLEDGHLRKTGDVVH